MSHLPVKYNLRTITASVTLDPVDDLVEVNSTADITITLPTATNAASHTFIIAGRPTIANTVIVTVTRSGTDTIASGGVDLTTKKIRIKYSKLVLVSDGASRWHAWIVS